MGVVRLSKSEIRDYEKYSSMLAGNPVFIPTDFDMIETTVVNSTASSITFSNLGDYSTTYKHLQIRGAIKTDRASAQDNLYIRFNGDSGNNYDLTWIRATQRDWTHAVAQDKIVLGETASASLSNNFGPLIVDLLDVFSTTKRKTTRGITSDSQLMTFNGGVWRSTAAITSVTLGPQFGTNWAIGTRISLYGIRG